ncbi:hypothetical protein [Desulfovibrio sp. TomC]|uniref:hypothetical protein n=1 Tax=Desulfovibrio sp. TomC TaxID=1562888 RepID=UPI0012E0F7BA|nr:hypothetical protein [Desulfovibrio sp. TomC]
MDEADLLRGPNKKRDHARRLGGSGPALLLLMRGDDWPDDQLVDREISRESGAEGDEAVSNEFDQVVLN